MSPTDAILGQARSLLRPGSLALSTGTSLLPLLLGPGPPSLASLASVEGRLLCYLSPGSLVSGRLWEIEGTWKAGRGSFLCTSSSKNVSRSYLNPWYTRLSMCLSYHLSVSTLESK